MQGEVCVHCRASSGVFDPRHVPLPVGAAQRLLCLAEGSVQPVSAGRREADQTHPCGLAGQREGVRLPKAPRRPRGHGQELLSGQHRAPIVARRHPGADRRQVSSRPISRQAVPCRRHTLDRRFDAEAPVTATLKGIYRAIDAAVGEAVLSAFDEGHWGRCYPAAVGQRWRRAWSKVVPLYAFPARSSHRLHHQRDRGAKRQAAPGRSRLRPLPNRRGCDEAPLPRLEPLRKGVEDGIL